jgi:RimJ/RimL family protein N-acetyltransferase
MTTLEAPVSTRREAHRQELAELLDLDPALLDDTALLRQELSVDSLAMMSLLAWLDTRGVTIGTGGNIPARVGDVLALLDKAAVSRLSIQVTGASGLRLPGPAELPTLRPSASPLVPVLSTPAFRLVPIEPDDLDVLYALAVAPETCFRWRYRGAPPPFDRFAADLWSHVLVQYVARRTGDNQVVGHVVAYGASQGLSHAYLGAVFHPQYAGTGLAAQTVALFVRYLFQAFPLRKLYLEIPGFNWPQMRSGEGRLFQIEGVLREHHYYAGRLWDQYLCAIYPDRLPAEDECTEDE